MAPSLGIYVSVPFCRAKCSFCNFSSGVFAAERVEPYLARLEAEIHASRSYASTLGAALPERVDSLYFGGGTPSLLEPEAITRIFDALRAEFRIDAQAEITVECAPGQLPDVTLQSFQVEGVNRLSFGVQSFVDKEAAAVGRTHTGAGCRAELRRLRAAGVTRLGIDLIAGLPHQTETSWRRSVEDAIASGVEHVSVYMLEVDEDSRLGREALAGGRRFGAAELPDDDRVADWYAAACEWLSTAGLAQYEISNFARPGGQSLHNRKYWEREPYLGFGLDAHSMLRSGSEAVRWANPDTLDAYVGPGLGSRGFARTVDRVGREASFEEALFLGLRLVEGVNLGSLRSVFHEQIDMIHPAIAEICDAGLAVHAGSQLCLTPRGRMASNEVFGRLLAPEAVSSTARLQGLPQRRYPSPMTSSVIDLRSDTVTKPSPAMRRAMADAEVGDDVYGEDPTVNRLEARSAEIFGREAAIFVPTGSMGNLIAARIHLQHGQEVICDMRAHILDWEMAQVAAYCGCMPRTVAAPRGVLTWDLIQPAIAPKIYYRAQTGLVWCENTANIAGGTVTPLAVAEAIWAGARAAGLPVHLDGARIFNASTALGVDVASLTRGYDTVMFCLSKGLGAPVGSMLVGSRDVIAEARVFRKALGGGMRQAGILAAAGLLALEQGPSRLAEDHRHARLLAEALHGIDVVEVDLESVETNIVIFHLRQGNSAAFAAEMKARGVIVSVVGQKTLRFVTHCDVSRADCERAVQITEDVLAATPLLALR